jgi:hypothetical protein
VWLSRAYFGRDPASIVVAPPIGLGARFPQALKKKLPVGDAAKDRFEVVAPIHHVIHRPFGLQPEFARHG